MPRVLQAGDLRARVGFYALVEQDDGKGNTVSGFAAVPAFDPVAANIRPRLGGEDVLAGRLTGKNLVNITVRQSAQTRRVGEDWKARDERAGVDYNIRSIVDPHEGTANAGRWIEMLAERGVAV